MGLFKRKSNSSDAGERRSREWWEQLEQRKAALRQGRDEVKALSKSGDLDAALAKALAQLDEAEAINRDDPATAPTEHLARGTAPPLDYYRAVVVLLRRMKRYDEEVVVLERLEAYGPQAMEWGAVEFLDDRLEKARALRDAG